AALPVVAGFALVSGLASAFFSVSGFLSSCLGFAASFCWALDFRSGLVTVLASALGLASGLAAGAVCCLGSILARGSPCASAAELPSITAKIVANTRIRT